MGAVDKSELQQFAAENQSDFNIGTWERFIANDASVSVGQGTAQVLGGLVAHGEISLEHLTANLGDLRPREAVMFGKLSQRPQLAQNGVFREYVDKLWSDFGAELDFEPMGRFIASTLMMYDSQGGQLTPAELREVLHARYNEAHKRGMAIKDGIEAKLKDFEAVVFGEGDDEPPMLDLPDITEDDFGDGEVEFDFDADEEARLDFYHSYGYDPEDMLVLESGEEARLDFYHSYGYYPEDEAGDVE